MEPGTTIVAIIAIAASYYTVKNYINSKVPPEVQIERLKAQERIRLKEIEKEEID